MKLGEMTKTGQGMSQLHFGSDLVDTQIRINLEIRI